MELGYGLLTLQRHPDEVRSTAAIYSEALTLAERAEQLGLASVWTAEHHLADDGYLPSSLVLLGAIAARTEALRLGTSLLLAPLHNPIRLAEDAAVVDLLSHGRLILGLGLGWRETEFEAFHVDPKRRGKALEQTVAYLRSSWTSSASSGDALGATPKPFAPSGIPIWIGGSTDVAVRRAGRIGDGYIATSLSPNEFANRRDTVVEGAALGSERKSIRLGLHWMVFASTDPDPWRQIRDYAWYRVWKYRDLSRPSTRAGLRRAPSPANDDLALTRRRIIVGSPEEVAAEIAEFDGVMGDSDVFIAGSYFPGLEPARQREALDALGQGVLPLLRRHLSK